MTSLARVSSLTSTPRRMRVTMPNTSLSVITWSRARMREPSSESGAEGDVGAAHVGGHHGQRVLVADCTPGSLAVVAPAPNQDGIL